MSTPITSPEVVSSGPPESPASMAASTSISPVSFSDAPVDSSDAVIDWSSAVTEPPTALGVPPLPPALPIATTGSPTLTAAVARVAVARPDAPESRSTATSCERS